MARLKMHRTAIAGLLLAIPVAASAQYKCVSASGSVSLQQLPCDGAAKVEQRLNIPRSALQQSPEQAAEAQQRLSVDRAVVSGYPIVGMPLVALERSLGPHDGITASDYGRGLEERRIYRRNGRVLRVYMAVGVVTAVEDFEGGDASRSTARATTPCYSELEIRNASVGMNSQSLSPAAHRRQMDEVERMRRCVR